RAVEEEADLVPVDEFEALVGERIELLWIDPGVLGGREAVEVEADRVAGRSPRVESFVDDPVVIVPRRVRVGLPDADVELPGDVRPEPRVRLPGVIEDILLEARVEARDLLLPSLEGVARDRLGT